MFTPAVSNGFPRERGATIGVQINDIAPGPKRIRVHQVIDLEVVRDYEIIQFREPGTPSPIKLATPEYVSNRRLH